MIPVAQYLEGGSEPYKRAIAFYNRGTRKRTGRSTALFKESMRPLGLIRLHGLHSLIGPTTGRWASIKRDDDYSRPCVTSPRLGEIYNSRGNALAAMRQFDRAIEDYSNLWRLILADPWLLNRGQGYSALASQIGIADYSEVSNFA